MKGKFSKNIKNLLLRNHKGDEAETCHTCVGHYSRSDKNSGCYGNLKFP